MRGSVKRSGWVVFIILVIGWTGIAQESVDEDSLLAMEEMTLTDAVEGELPDAEADDDDLLADLLAAEDAAEEAEPELEEDVPLEALPLDESVAEDVGASLEEVPAEDLEGAIEGVEIEADAMDELEVEEVAEPAAPMPEADAETAEVTPVADDVDLEGAMEELGLPGDDPDMAEMAMSAEEEPPDALTEAPVEDEADTMADISEEGLDEIDDEESLEDLLGEMTAEEPAADMEAPEASPIPEDVEAAAAEADAAAAEEKGMDDFLSELEGEPPETVDEEMGSEAAVAEDAFTADEEPAVEAAVAEEPVEADDDLEAMLGELAAEPEPELSESELEAVEAVDDEDPEMAEPTVPEAAEPEPDLESETMVEIVEAPPEDEAPAAGDDVAEDKGKAGYTDEMALEDDIFVDLAAEAQGDLDAEPVLTEEPPEAAAVEVEDAAESPMEAPAPEMAMEPEPAPEPEAEVAAEPAAESPRKSPSVTAFETAERLKRMARESHAIDSLKRAEKQLGDENYSRAIVLYQEALKYLPIRDDLAPMRQRARRGLAGAHYRRALQYERIGDYEEALVSAVAAVKFGYKRAEKLVTRIKAAIEAPPKKEPEPQYRWEEEDYKTTEMEIDQWLRRGRQAYLTGEYEKAILAFESVLARDPENKEAQRLMRGAAQKQYDRSTSELEATRTRMMAMVRDTWNPRQYGLHEVPADTPLGLETETSTENAERDRILEKLKKIRIPEIDFRQANIRDVIDFLHQQSVEADPMKDTDEPGRRPGVNIILKLDDTGERASKPAASDDPFAAPAEDVFGGGAAPVGDETLVTFSALDITLKEALDIVVDVANLKYRIRGSVVIILPRNAPESDIEHRMYDVLSTAITRLEELSQSVASNRRDTGGGDFLALEGGADFDSGMNVDLKAFFKEMGVEWPANSSIKFVRGIGKLVVANTLENLAVFEKVLSILNVVPYQIEIEARFVEVAQTDVDSLGLEWILNDNWEVAQKKGSAGLPLAARQRLVIDQNAASGGFTKGNRFLTTSPPGGGGEFIADDLLSLSGVLTNPELTMVLHALQQRGHTDVLSAPKITTQSGQQATIKVVTEYIYPTEFETQGISGRGQNNNVNNQVNNNGGVVGATVTPGAFETREVGVILEVLPEVSPEGQMINLTLSPEVVSEPTWKNYGSEYTSYDPDGNPQTQQLNMEQPFFHTRTLRTNLLLYNGATVVMGGMITEVRNDVVDKIPLLGDIPIVGRLFRSRYESSEKRNLLIFVTARLVDPSGRPLDSSRLGVGKSIAEKLVTE